MIRAGTAAGSALLLVAVMLAAACDVPPGPCGLVRCDVREPSCKRRVIEATGCLRGETAPATVPIVVVGRQEFIDAQVAAPLTPEQEKSIVTWNGGLSLLGLAEPLPTTEIVATSAGRVGAYYSGDSKQIVLIDDGSPLDSFDAVGLLAHELTHAIQDVRWDLRSVREGRLPELDDQLALGAVVEGEATLVGDLAMLELFGTAHTEIDWPGIFANWQRGARRAARTSSLPVTLSWSHFRYPFGTAFVKQAFDASGWAGVDELMRALPISAGQVIEGVRTVDSTGVVWAEDLAADAVPNLTGRFTYFDSDRLGPWIVNAFVRRLEERHPDGRYLDPDGAISEPARALTDDRLSIFVDQATGELVAIWRLRFSVPVFEVFGSMDYALQVLAADPRFRVQQLLDRDLVIVAAPNEQVLYEIPEDPPFQRVPASPSTPIGASAGFGHALPRGCAHARF